MQPTLFEHASIIFFSIILGGALGALITLFWLRRQRRDLRRQIKGLQFRLQLFEREYGVGWWQLRENQDDLEADAQTQEIFRAVMPEASAATLEETLQEKIALAARRHFHSEAAFFRDDLMLSGDRRQRRHLRFVGGRNALTKTLQGYCHDVTDEIAAQENAFNCKQVISQLLKQIPCGVVVTDQRGNIVEINSLAAQFFDCTPTEAVGHYFDSLAGVAGQLAPLLETSPQQQGRRAFTLSLPRQGTRAIRVQAYLLRDSENLPAGGVIFFEAQGAENKQESIPKAQVEVTAHLLKKLAENFSGIFGAIFAGLDLLKETLAELTPYQSVCTAAENGRALLEQMRYYAQSMTAHKEALNLSECIKGALEDFNDKFTGEITLTQNFSAEISQVTIAINCMQLKAALREILQNSLAALAESGGKITVSASFVQLDKIFCQYSKYEITPGEYAEIKICDTGSGVAEEVLSQIFLPFYSTNRLAKGNGLGLTLAQALAVTHNGALQAKNLKPHGFAISLYLPRH